MLRRSRVTQSGTRTARCQQCGAEVESSWTFCGACGSAAHIEGAASHESVLAQPVPIFTSSALGEHFSNDTGAPMVAPHDRRRSRGRLLTYVLGTLVLVVLATAAGFWQFETQQKLDAARADLATTRQALQATVATLGETEDQLSSTQLELDDTTADLEATETKMRATQRRLTGVRGSLDDAENRLDLQANQIETLKSCLNGVSDALIYVAYNNFNAALAALEAVEISCQRANEYF